MAEIWSYNFTVDVVTGFSKENSLASATLEKVAKILEGNGSAPYLYEVDPHSLSALPRKVKLVSGLLMDNRHTCVEIALATWTDPELADIERLYTSPHLLFFTEKAALRGALALHDEHVFEARAVVKQLEKASAEMWQRYKDIKSGKVVTPNREALIL